MTDGVVVVVVIGATCYFFLPIILPKLRLKRTAPSLVLSVRATRQIHVMDIIISKIDCPRAI